jgi:hypothetical protein
MGLLDNSTNNILVDAVLTEKGREVFASNGANLDEAGLVIVKFAVADDEVDYTNLTKYGLELGRERIEKLTPVFESSTNTQLALRRFLTTFSDDDLLAMPSLRLNREGGSTVNLSKSGTGTTSSEELTFNLVLASGEEITSDQIDPLYLISVPGRFLRIEGFTPVGLLPDRTEIYEIPAGTTKFTITVSLKPFPDSLFETFGANSGNPDLIRTRMNITGVASGATKEVLVNISRNNA